MFRDFDIPEERSKLDRGYLMHNYGNIAVFCSRCQFTGLVSFIACRSRGDFRINLEGVDVNNILRSFFKMVSQERMKL